MEYLVIIGVAIVISLLDDRLRGKKKVPPPVPQKTPRPKKRKVQGGTFEIPPMRGTPSDVQVAVDAEVLREQELRAKWEEARKEEQRVREREERAARLAAEEAQAAAALMPQTAKRMSSVLLPQLTADTMKQAVVLSEVLGKPRGLRRFPRR